jgi:hypothetical protein
MEFIFIEINGENKDPNRGLHNVKENKTHFFFTFVNFLSLAKKSWSKIKKI